MLLKYVRDYNGNKVGCVVAVKQYVGYSLGWSQCCGRDTFNKERAIKIAVGRANIGTNARPTKVKSFVETSEGLQIKKIDLFQKELNDMQRRANAYFQNDMRTKNEWSSTIYVH